MYCSDQASGFFHPSGRIYTVQPLALTFQAKGHPSLDHVPEVVRSACRFPPCHSWLHCHLSRPLPPLFIPATLTHTRSQRYVGSGLQRFGLQYQYHIGGQDVLCYNRHGQVGSFYFPTPRVHRTSCLPTILIIPSSDLWVAGTVPGATDTGAKATVEYAVGSDGGVHVLHHAGKFESPTSRTVSVRSSENGTVGDPRVHRSRPSIQCAP